MRLRLERFGYGSDSTLGRLSINGRHECYTIEDERREVKVPGETAIPPGTYKVTLRTEGGLHQKYKRRFPDLHRGMLWLRSVPNFKWVYLHIGNTDDDTEGCPLTVTTPIVTAEGEFEGTGSVNAYRSLYKRVAAALDRGEPVTLEITEK